MRALCVAVSVLAAGAAGTAAAAREYAAVVMDARDGAVLHARNADARLHPASLTKMMTLYLVIEAVETGRLDLDQRVRVSRHAASMPASKIGFRPGQRVRIRDLIRSAAVRSANDSAVVLAEAVAGSEAAFARLMTAKARAMGMSSTTFRNASGLTARGHLSTARDMAVLSRHVLYDYPEYYNLFGRRSTRAFGRTIWTTNKLLGRYRGADGIKTGYTRAAGFNLSASAERGGERVIAVVFGGRSSASRNREVARLLDLGFSRAPSRVAFVAPETTAPRRAPTPPVRPGIEPAQSPSLLAASARRLEAGARTLGAALTPAAAHAAEPEGSSGPILVAATRYAPTVARTPPPRPGARGEDDWTIRLGAYAERERAIADLAAAAFGALPQLAEARREIDVLGAGATRRYVAQLSGLAAADAQEGCRRLVQEGRTCRAAPAD